MVWRFHYTLFCNSHLLIHKSIDFSMLFGAFMRVNLMVPYVAIVFFCDIINSLWPTDTMFQVQNSHSIVFTISSIIVVSMSLEILRFFLFFLYLDLITQTTQWWTLASSPLDMISKRQLKLWCGCIVWHWHLGCESVALTSTISYDIRQKCPYHRSPNLTEKLRNRG